MSPQTAPFVMEDPKAVLEDGSPRELAEEKKKLLSAALLQLIEFDPRTAKYILPQLEDSSSPHLSARPLTPSHHARIPLRRTARSPIPIRRDGPSLRRIP